jgi:hypothetical protein
MNEVNGNARLVKYLIKKNKYLIGNRSRGWYFKGVAYNELEGVSSGGLSRMRTISFIPKEVLMITQNRVSSV